MFTILTGCSLVHGVTLTIFVCSRDSHTPDPILPAILHIYSPDKERQTMNLLTL